MLLGLALVVTGSVAHATWNLLAKRSGATGPAFVWLYSALVTPALLALVLLRAAGPEGLVWSHWWAGVISAGLHTAYALVLQRSYASGELGVVYPVARAGAPVLVALAALPLLHQRAAPTLWLGLAVIAAGVALLLGTRSSSAQAALRGAVAGAVTAVAIASYTLWDGYAVRGLHVDVLTYLAIGSAAQLIVLTLAVAPQHAQLPALARRHWRFALPIAVLVPLSYGLVLAALHSLDVQTVAALRSTSIIAAAALGWWLLDEPRDTRRITGAIVTSLGVAVVALGT